MARDQKLSTVIENATGQGLTMKVGHSRCFARLASVKNGGEYTVRLCLDWTYQEFVFEGKSDTDISFSVSSDDCCDYERITVKQARPGVFVAETLARKHALWDARQEVGGGDPAAPMPPFLPLTKEGLFRWFKFW